MANKKYDIHNPTPAPRVIYDANMVAVGIPSGGTTPNVELTDVHAKELQERTKEKPDADVTLTVATGTSARDTKEPVKENEGGDGGGEGGAGGETDRQAQAKALVDSANEIEFNEWRGKVKDFLGDDFPPGIPRKKQLVAKLKRIK
jgi:hypothetical protein